MLATLYSLPMDLAVEVSASLEDLSWLISSDDALPAQEVPASSAAASRALQVLAQAVHGEQRRLEAVAGQSDLWPRHNSTEQPGPRWPPLPPLPVLVDPNVSHRIWCLITIAVIFLGVVVIGNCRCLFRVAGEAVAGDLVNINLPGEIGADGILSAKERRWLFLTMPEVMGPCASAFTVMMSCTIQISLVMMVLSSFKSLTDAYPGGFDLLEWYLVFIFTGEWMAKVMSCPDLASHLTKTMTWIDLAATIPSFLYVFKKQTHGSSGGNDWEMLKLARLFRCFRLFRLAKLLGKSETIEIISIGLQEAVPSFSIALVMITVAVYVPSVVMFYVEQGDWDADMGCFRRTLHTGEFEAGCSPFQNIIESAYWGFTTVTTVGYGDVLPTTGVGQCCACGAMVAGILALSLPIGMMSNAFTDALEKVQKEHTREEAECNALATQAASASATSQRGFPPERRPEGYGDAREFRRLGDTRWRL